MTDSVSEERPQQRRYDITEHGFKEVPRGSVIGVEGYSIGQWSDSLDGSTPPNAVTLTAHTKAALGVNIMIRFKSRHAINTFITIMERHRDEVFPPPPSR